MEIEVAEGVGEVGREDVGGGVVKAAVGVVVEFGVLDGEAIDAGAIQTYGVVEAAGGIGSRRIILPP